MSFNRRSWFKTNYKMRRLRNYYSWHFDDHNYWIPVIMNIDNVDKYLSDMYERYPDIPKARLLYEPIINNQDAFWKNSCTLCTGYVLKNNVDVFRPIYSIKNIPRVKNIWNINDCIPYIVKKRKDYLILQANLVLLQNKNLPVDIINIIIDFM